MAAYILQLVALASGDAHPYAGQWLVEYDPSIGQRPRECLLRVSPRIERAKRFPSRESAFEEWRRIDTRAPIRPDGKRNRPLTAFTIHIQEAPTEDDPD